MKKPTKQTCYVIISIGLLMFVMDFLILMDMIWIKKDLSWIDWLVPLPLLYIGVSGIRKEERKLFFFLVILENLVKFI
ncbi:MAG: hypothetical protein RR585_03265 [Coprobacillus sp.]